MACICKKNNGTTVATAERNHDGGPAAVVKIEMTVRGEGNPLACDRCLMKHLAKALVYVAETEEEPREAERYLSVANLSCAAEHAEALKDDRSKKIAELTEGVQPTPAAIRALLPAGGDAGELAIGRLGVAEDALRFIGRNDLANRVRAARLELMEKTLESQRVAGVEEYPYRETVAAASAGGSPVAEKKAEGATGLSAPAPAATTGEKQ